MCRAEANRETLLASNGIETVINAMNMFTWNEMVQCKACWVLSTLASQHGTCMHFFPMTWLLQTFAIECSGRAFFSRSQIPSHPGARSLSLAELYRRFGGPTGWRRRHRSGHGRVCRRLPSAGVWHPLSGCPHHRQRYVTHVVDRLRWNQRPLPRRTCFSLVYARCALSGG